MNFFLLNDLFYKSQFGFRNNHSTEYAILELQDKILDSMSKGNIQTGDFIDLSKAFDTINHTILLNKLKQYNIFGIALNWFEKLLIK